MEKSTRQKLTEQIQEVKQLLKDRPNYYTTADKEAIEDMMHKAELALDGNMTIPFTRHRKFYVPREDEQVEFAWSRTSKAPSYMHIWNHGYYGFKEALEWFKNRDLLNMSKEQIQKRIHFVIQSAELMLDETQAGTNIGEYDITYRTQLINCLEELKSVQNCEPEIFGESLIRTENALRNYRFSRVLRSDIESDYNLFISSTDLDELKKSISNDELLSQQVQQIKEIANRYSLEDIELAYDSSQSEADHYEELNKHLYMWSYTDKVANFSAPERAVKANISFILPSKENEEEGLGHVWIDDVEVISASGASMNIDNPGFESGEEKPDGWSFVSQKGNAKMRWEDQHPYCGLEKRSIYIENPTNNDEGVWNHDRVYEVTGGGGYTLTFRAKIDGKFKKGLKTVISFWDNNNQPLEEYVYYFNRKSWLPPVCFALEMQCDAIMYMLTRDQTYAQKAKTEMLHVTNEFCQGVEFWLVYDERPEDCDAYGAVQGGRILSSLAGTYMLIRNAGVFTEEEKQTLYKRISYILDDMLDLRDRTCLPTKRALKNCGNWQIDMCTGTLLFMLAAPDYPEHRKTWIYNAHYILKNQLIDGINTDGSWPESIRYHFAALMRFPCVARSVQHMMGEDWFIETDLNKMFTYVVDMQTPKYVYKNNHISTPTFGDHMLTDGEEFAIFGIYLDMVQKLHKPTADKMYATWEAAGKPMPPFGNERVTFENLLVKNSYQVEPGFQLHLKSTQDYKDSGIYVFRKDYGCDKESYFAIMSSLKLIGHGHLDQGSFILYKDSVPIIMDSAIEGYFDVSTQWHLSSYSHACVLFQNTEVWEKKPVSALINLSAGDYSRERGWCDTPDHSKVLECTTEGNVKTITVEIENTGGPGRHIRKVVYIQPDDIYIIHDKILEFDGDVLFNLPIVSTESVIRGKTVLSKCHYGLELETTFLSETKNIQLDRGRTLYIAPEQNYLEYIRATANAAEGFLTILEPRKVGSKCGYRYDKKDGCLIVTTNSLQEIKIEGV